MRELGPISTKTPSFPLAGGAIAPLRAKSEPAGSSDFMNLWSGQAAALALRDLPAFDLTRFLAAEALIKFGFPG
jgi:nitronate monooxygenase